MHIVLWQIQTRTPNVHHRTSRTVWIGHMINPHLRSDIHWSLSVIMRARPSWVHQPSSVWTPERGGTGTREPSPANVSHEMRLSVIIVNVSHDMRLSVIIVNVSHEMRLSVIIINVSHDMRLSVIIVNVSHEMRLSVIIINVSHEMRLSVIIVNVGHYTGGR